MLPLREEEHEGRGSLEWKEPCKLSFAGSQHRGYMMQELAQGLFWGKANLIAAKHIVLPIAQIFSF